MRKLKLNFEDLVIDSFTTTTRQPVTRGTVRGAANTRDPYTVVIADTVVTCTVWPSDPLASADCPNTNPQQSANPLQTCGYMCATNPDWDGNCQFA
jgi:hypothetical protein